VTGVRSAISGSISEVRSRSIRRILERRHLDPTASIVLCSEARSGSTWLMELFGQLAGTVCSWEPFHPDRGALPADWDMGWRPYVPEHDADDRLVDWFDQLFRFRIANDWTLSQTSLIQARRAEVGVHKFIRAALLLPWMVRHLTLERPPIFLVRHPLATVSSKNANFAVASTTGIAAATGDDPLDDRYAEIVRSQRDPTDVRIARWCNANRVALNHPAAGTDWIIVHYEHLLLDPQVTMRSLLDAIGWPDADGAVTALDVGRASRSDFTGALADSPQQQLGKWIDRADARTLERTQELLDQFGIVDYRADDAMPVR